MKASGRSTTYVFWLWLAVAAGSTLAAALGFAVLGDASPTVVATTHSFAAGAA